jgi:hypothetical protein
MDWAAVQMSPAFGFTVVGLVIVFGPLVAERLRLPGLLGLLAFGADHRAEHARCAAAPDIASHVEQAEPIGRERADR